MTENGRGRGVEKNRHQKEKENRKIEIIKYIASLTRSKTSLKLWKIRNNNYIK
jgi:hypothetical protein